MMRSLSLEIMGHFQIQTVSFSLFFIHFSPNLLYFYFENYESYRNIEVVQSILFTSEQMYF